MNVIVSNKYQTLLSNLNIDVIKNVNGVYSVDDLAVQFRNFFYNKMILDITALEDYEDVNTIQRLSVALDMAKVILLLDDSPKVNSARYLSSLVSMGIYNFTKNVWNSRKICMRTYCGRRRKPCLGGSSLRGQICGI